MDQIIVELVQLVLERIQPKLKQVDQQLLLIMRMEQNRSVSHLVYNSILIIVESDGLVQKVEVVVEHFLPFHVHHLFLLLVEILEKILLFRLVGQVVHLDIR